MLTAIRERDKAKVIGENIVKDISDTYRCEYCNNSVIHHHSEAKVKIGHFKHRPGETHCPNNTGESLLHLKTKLSIYEYINSNFAKGLQLIATEHWICNRTIRPDIYLETRKGYKIAIEVQATSLTVDEIRRRTENYFSNDVYVLWVLPYDDNRFHAVLPDMGYDSEGRFCKVGEYRGLNPNIRFKEYELFLYACYFKRLYYWDLEIENPRGFISIRFEDCRTEVVSFYKEGEEQVVGGARTKTTKSAQGLTMNLPLSDFRPLYAKAYSPFNKKYFIPERKIMVRRKN